MSRASRHDVTRLILPAACILAAATTSVIGQTVTTVSVGTQSRDIVQNGAALKPFVAAAQTRRVDILGIGDSNQIAGPGNDYGWDHGYAKAWSDRFGEYATSMFGMNAKGAWDSGQGYFASGGYPYGAASTGAPASLDQYKIYYDAAGAGINNMPGPYAYFPSGYQEPANLWTPSMYVTSQNPLWGKDLVYHLTYGTFANGNGGFTPVATTGFSPIVTAPRVNPVTGTEGLADMTMNVPAQSYKNATEARLQFGMSAPASATMTGPFFGLWQRVDAPSQTSGVGYGTLVAQGGRAMVQAAMALQAQSDAALQQYLKSLVSLQNGAPTLLVNVNHGGNDGGWHIPSVGPAHVADSSTPAGFADDMDAIIQRLRGAWTGAGYDTKNLFFEYGPYHPTAGDVGDGRTKLQRLADWENAIVQLSQQHPDYNLAVVRGTRITTPLTMKTNGWYDALGDAHLTPGGYIGVSDLAVTQAVAYSDPGAFHNLSSCTSLNITFDQDVSANLSAGILQLRNLNNDQLLDESMLAVDWDPKSLTATWTFQGLPFGALPAGEYEATLDSSSLISAPGTDVGDFQITFLAQPIPEPASAAVLLLGAVGLVSRRSRRS